MQRKIAKRWRRRALRRGAVINSEGWVFSKSELAAQGSVRRDNAYAIEAIYNGSKYSLCDDDELSTYKLLNWCLDVDDGRGE